MKSTILYIIVKQWFKDKSGTELDDAVLEAIIKELKEEPQACQGIHYESEKDAEAKAELIEWISVKHIMPTKDDYDKKGFVWASLSDGIIIEAYEAVRGWVSHEGYKLNNVTHWQPKHKKTFNVEPILKARAKERKSKKSKWIEVNDRKPQENKLKCSKDVLVYYKSGEIKIGFTHEGYWQNVPDRLKSSDIKYWRPLPKTDKNK